VGGGIRTGGGKQKEIADPSSSSERLSPKTRVAISSKVSPLVERTRLPPDNFNENERKHVTLPGLASWKTQEETGGRCLAKRPKGKENVTKGGRGNFAVI